MSNDAHITVPSGQPMTLLEVIANQPGEGLAYRFRFVAPEIARERGEMDFEMIGADMEYLCNSYALPRIPLGGPVPNQIIISIADRPTPFGDPVPEATQVFEAYTIDVDTCLPEPF